MQLAVFQEHSPECRVALTPAALPLLLKAGWQVLVQSGAGQAAGFDNNDYLAKGARIVDELEELYAADVLLRVRVTHDFDRARLRAGQILIGLFDPLGSPETARQLAGSGATCFALELIPRTTRAQSMDVLSSMATVAGYRAVLLAAVHLPKMFPMLMTAAGTITPAKLFVLGAGVAGLQAIASARRLGAVVQAYDVRPACREQVESLGGKFVELGLESAEAEDKSGYAKALGDDFTRRQQAALGKIVAESDVVISTAAIPGQKSPVLITPEAVEQMRYGSVIVDLAAERGGNCPLTQADRTTIINGVTILGPTNLPAEIPHDASLMFANNVTKFLLNMFPKGQQEVNYADDIVQATLVTKGGDVVQPRVRLALGM
ncbi:MAG TPA: NAD(P) transhydrogenase subunit alpha, partial [Pirellulaceae bacterium]|nr:NAD(P) transhydrogenase subunit alpha [Pirellulaceae bacterium]